MLIGADGIHSAVREALYPDEGPARWNGAMLWRWPQFLTGRSIVIAGGMEAKLVIYPIGEGGRSGRPLTNWAVLVKIAQGGVHYREGPSGPAPVLPCSPLSRLHPNFMHGSERRDVHKLET